MTALDLFIDRRKISSQKGTSQSDPIAMAMNGVDIHPHIDMLVEQNLSHEWYPDGR